MGFYTCSRLIVPIMYRRAFRRGELSYLSEEDYLVWKKAMLTMLKEFCFAGFNIRIRKTIQSAAVSTADNTKKMISQWKTRGYILQLTVDSFKKVKNKNQ